MNKIFHLDGSLDRSHWIVDSQIAVLDLRVDAMVGVYDHERQGAQPLLIDVSLQTRPATSGQFCEVFDYARVVEIAERLATEHIDLIETFAYRLAAECLDDGLVLKATVQVSKPKALSNGTPSVQIVLARAQRSKD